MKQAAGYFQKLKDANLKNPIMIGFNIHNKENFDFACQYSRGAIIGSAFIKAISPSKELEKDVLDFVRMIR